MKYNFLDSIDKTEDVFDLIAICYEILDEGIANQQNFIARYFINSLEHPESDNPNLLFLNSKLIPKFVNLFMEFPYWEYVNIKKRLIASMQRVQLKAFGSQNENELSLIYALLSAIDTAAMNWDKKRICSTLGPLNNINTSKYAVYFYDKDSINREIVEKIGRERVHGSKFKENFISFRLIKKTSWMAKVELPQIKYISTHRWNDLKLNVAVLPAENKKIFKAENTRGGILEVKYHMEQEEAFCNNIILQLKKSIQEMANIIIMPEYVVSGYTLDRIKKQLQCWYVSKEIDMSKFLVLFAGSTAENGDNIMHMLNAWGGEYGKYYKYSPYVKKKNNKIIKCERLDNPGKECVVLYMQGIGCILPAICRDVIDNEYTYIILSNIAPALLFVAAWSESVNKFKEHFEKYAKEQYVSSVLCNGCAIVHRDREIINYASIVEKKDTVAGCKFVPLRREEDCVNNCCEGCCFILTYNFAVNVMGKEESVVIRRI